MIRALIRTDGQPADGLGHIRRGLSLGEALRQAGVEVRFLLDGTAGAAAHIAACGFSVQRVDPRAVPTEPVDLLVVDSYRADQEYLAAMRRHARVTAAIDDLGDRAIPVDVLINSVPGADQLPYRTEPQTRCLFGPRYALLRRPFAVAPQRVIAERVHRLLVIAGGGNAQEVLRGWTQLALAALPEADVHVVAGPLVAAPEALVARDDPQRQRVRVHTDPPKLWELMRHADLALTAGGQTTHELAATGTPAVAVRVADNQTRNLEGLAAAGALRWAGDLNDAELPSRVIGALRELAQQPALRKQMSAHARALIDGLGIERITRTLLGRLGQPPRERPVALSGGARRP